MTLVEEIQQMSPEERKELDRKIAVTFFHRFFTAPILAYVAVVGIEKIIEAALRRKK